MIRRVLVTGASGFVARALLGSKVQGMELIGASRRDPGMDEIEWRGSPSLSPLANWAPLLEGIDTVVHLAGRVHLPPNADPDAYHAENCEGTLKLANDAVSSGVRQFVFLSTSKVVGDESGERGLDERSLPRPGDDYASSKFSAEQSLAALGSRLQLTVLRPPLVYGPGVRANFLALMAAVDRGLPMPIASIRNRRSLIGVDNLASAIVACLVEPKAAGRTFHVTDGVACSTPDLVRAIGRALGRSPNMFGFPPFLLEAAGALLGRGETIKRLTRSLELDDSAIRETLGWRPVKTFEEGLADTARWYRERFPR